VKALVDRTGALREGLAHLRSQFQLPQAFPPEVLAAAEAAAARPLTDHADRAERPFVTLDPGSSTDLDQAFALETAGSDIVLHYAIADVGWFVQDGDVIDQEAWRRGETLYLPDGRIGLYPPILSEIAASLLPTGPRPAVVFTVRIDPAGEVRLDGAERAIIRSRAKLAYESVQASELPEGFAELSRRIAAAEAARGASRVDPPEQEVVASPGGGYELRFRPRAAAEDQNAGLSLACNLAVAQVLMAHHTGLFRVMAAPDDWAIRRLRYTARALGVGWAKDVTLPQLQRRLNPARSADAAMMLAIRRARPGAAYAPFSETDPPWHAAMAATYAHATAPLRRLADRYVIETALAVANGRSPPDSAVTAFAKLPDVMAKADALAGQLNRAAIDLAEAVMLRRREGERFPAVITDVDARGARAQLCDIPVVTRVVPPAQAKVGDDLDLRLTDAAGLVARFEAA
jgi:exoribonuclease R